jgi:hypothetical protein
MDTSITTTNGMLALSPDVEEFVNYVILNSTWIPTTHANLYQQTAYQPINTETA